ncbi:acetate--CoA ligase family protein [Brevibacterium antiquum]|uniref:acetate--CoA ligase family protein n=1 Tax=Brevibacterium antiquum TaxID=234835 RepID=UPI0018DFD601|nr:acetate--CoA ligase family protein [Brevibacterium antiquum]
MMVDLLRLQRFLNPRSIAVIGGSAAEKAIEQCRNIGFDGTIWSVNPRRTTLGGLPCYPSVGDLPGVPDAALVAVPAGGGVEVVGQLADLGAGGVVCHASGFAEDSAEGAELQQQMVAAAGSMPLIGPNCIGTVNYLDGAALWPDEHGGHRVDRGVAVITQSGNIAQNISMQHRGMPLAFLATLGNSAQLSTADLISGLLEDDRITAIGVHMETVGDVEALSQAANAALRKNVPIIALKSGTSQLGEQANLSHTNSFASPNVLVDTMFSRLGIGRVHDVSTFIETLKLLHVHGAAHGNALTSASCSGGEAALVADAAEAAGLNMPPLPPDTLSELAELLGPRVHVRNPLDYHTYIWGDEEAQQACFELLLAAGSDLHILTVDVPRGDRSDPSLWLGTLRAFIRAHGNRPSPAAVISLMPGGLSEEISEDLIAAGIVPLQGLPEAMLALRTAAAIGAAQARPEREALEPGKTDSSMLTDGHLVDEASAKRLLTQRGLPVPDGCVVSTPVEAGQAAARLGFPVVAKVVSPVLAHKSDVGGVRVGLRSEGEVIRAVKDMEELGERFLVEHMITDGIAELVVGVKSDPQFGKVLTLGLGGVLVEVVRDFATLLLPAGPDEVELALQSLQFWPVLDGVRGRQKADVPAAVTAIGAIIDYITAEAGGISELEINPLIVRAQGNGAVAVDVLLRQTEKLLTPPRETEFTPPPETTGSLT